MKKIASAVLKFRVLIIILSIAVTILLGINLKDIKINSDVTTYLPADDPSVELFKYIGQEYSMSWTAMILIEGENIFSAATISHVNDITQELRFVEGVDYVTSLTNVMDIRKTEDGFEINRLIDEFYLPETDEELQELKNYILSNELFTGRLVDKQGRYTLIVGQINENYDKNEVAKEIRTRIEALDIPETLYFEGMPYQVQSIFQSIIDDLLLLTPLIIVLILLSLYLSFRTLRGVLLPILAVSMGIVWSMSLMAIFGVALTPLSDALPVVLFAVGSAYGIHVVNKIKISVRSKENKLEELKKAIEEIGLAVILAGVTTFVGFMSFTFSSYLTIVSDFGIFSALGVIFILVLSITFIPAVISYFPVEREKSRKRSTDDNILNIFLKKLSVFVVTKKKLLFYGGIIIMLIAIAGIPLIERKVDILEYFKPDSEIRRTAALMNKEFGGSLPIQVVANGDIQKPEVMQKLKDITVFLNNLEDVNNARSIADYIEEMNDAMGEGKQVPNTREKIANLWFMIESEEIITQMVNYDKNEAVIYASMVNVDAKRVHEIDAAINNYVNSLNTDELNFRVTGLQSIYAKLDDSMMKNLMQSMILAFVFIFITMIFLLGSVKGALVGMITLFFSIVFVFGFMGFTGIALDIATILIAGVTVGIGIDYAIHFVTSYKNNIYKGQNVDDALKTTIQTTGRAIVINVFTIILGFLVLLFANLIPLQQFGILIAVTMFCSGIGAITLMPAVISFFQISIVKIKIKNNFFKNGEL